METSTGRVGRGQYILGLLLLSAIFVVGVIAYLVLGFSLPAPLSFLLIVLLPILEIVLVVYTFTLHVRRLQDIGWSGWWVILLLIPFVNLILFIMLLSIKGDAQTNKYGAVSPADRHIYDVIRNRKFISNPDPSVVPIPPAHYKNILIGLVVFFVLVIGGTITFFSTHKTLLDTLEVYYNLVEFAQTGTSTPGNILDQVQSISTSTWETHTDSQYQFSIQYPPDWPVVQGEPRSDGVFGTLCPSALLNADHACNPVFTVDVPDGSGNGLSVFVLGQGEMATGMLTGNLVSWLGSGNGYAYYLSYSGPGENIPDPRDAMSLAMSETFLLNNFH